MAWVDEVVDEITFGLHLEKKPHSLYSNHDNEEANKEVEKEAQANASKLREHFPNKLAAARRLWRDEEDASKAVVAGESESSEVSDGTGSDGE